MSINKGNWLYEALKNHRGHNVSIATYGDWDKPNSICLECEDCNEVILDAETLTVSEKDVV